MKKIFILCLTALTIALTGCARQTSNGSDVDCESMSQKTDLSMPDAFDHNGGDENNDFYLPCTPKFDSVSTTLFDLVGDDAAIQQWVDEMNANETPCDLDEYINIYSFMVYFSLSADDVCNALEKSNAFFEQWLNEGLTGVQTAIFTDEELDVLRTGDKEAIAAQFASDYSIVVENKIYSPNWVYYHTAEDYAACGITAEMLEEAAPKYAAINFTAEAQEALENKLSDYLQTTVSLE